VGAVVPWAKAKISVIAAQAWINVAFGPNGIRLLQDELSEPEAPRNLLEIDSRPEVRQAAIIDAKGQVAVHTGNEC